MSLTRATVAAGAGRLRIRPWRGSSMIAELSPTHIAGPLSPLQVSEALERARDLGYHRVVTPALQRNELRPFLDAGCRIREHLHLLSHDLRDLPDRPHGVSRRARRRDWADVLDIDAAAFPPFWRLDRAALADALDATPHVRLRITTDQVGYVLFGRARSRGYLQRLAVRPDAQGSGRASALLVEGMWWLRRWRVRQVLVNTQEANQRALALYESHGFQRHRVGLAVVEAEVAR